MQKIAMLNLSYILWKSKRNKILNNSILRSINNIKNLRPAKIMTRVMIQKILKIKVKIFLRIS